MKYCHDCRGLVIPQVEESRDLSGETWITAYCPECGLCLSDQVSRGRDMQASGRTA
jgi:RNase P subunit RPR2